MAEGNRIDTLNNSDMTLLYTRVDENNSPFANLLERVIKNDAEINEQDGNGDTALHIAIDKDADLNTLRTLMEKDANFKVSNNDSKTPLECLNYGSWNTALNLLKLSKYFNFNNETTLLHMILDEYGYKIWGVDLEDENYSRQEEVIELFWKGFLNERTMFEIDMNFQNLQGQTPLHLAANCEHPHQHIEVMLTHFGEINPFVVDKNGYTFLHIYFARPSVAKDTIFFPRMLHGELPNLPKQHVQKLLNTQNKFLESPLLMFIKEKRDTVNATNLQRIIDAGSCVNLCEIVQNTPLHCVLADYIHGEEEILDRSLESLEKNEITEEENIKCLIKNGATINAQNVEGESPLFMASNKKCIDTLLDLGADIKLRNKFGHTALLSCINDSDIDIEIVETFLNRGSDNALDFHGGNILHYVAWHGVDPEILPMLEMHGIVPVLDQIGQLPCHVAYHCGNKELFDQMCICDKGIHEQKEHFVFQKEVLELSDFQKTKSESIDAIVNRTNLFLQRKTEELMRLPGLGLVTSYYKEEVSLIKSVVKDLVNNICKHFTDGNDILSITPVESGSFGEETKVGFPDEFDFVCILDKLGEMCFLDEEKTPKKDEGFACLKLKEQFNEEKCREFFDGEGYLQTGKIRNKFGKVLEGLSMTREIFSHPNISILNASTVAINRPTSKFTLRWVGAVYKDMIIDVDLVLACHTKGWLPQNSNIPSFYCDTEEFREEGVLLMLQTDDEYMLNLRISPQRVEKLLLNRIPKVAKDAYIVAKILTNSRICPMISETEAKDVVTSYMLKNCMLHTLFSQARAHDAVLQEDVGMNNDIYTSDQLHDFVIKIFQTFLQFSVEEKLPCFIFPWQNVYTSDMIAITDPYANHCVCAHRVAFAKLIMGILGEKQDYCTDI